jgi:PKD repeat protein
LIIGLLFAANAAALSVRPDGTSTSSFTMPTTSSSSQGEPLSVSPSASPYTGNSPLSVQFRANAAGGAPPYSYSWAFGDGTVGSGSSPTHVYNAGSYTATVVVTDSDGNSATAAVGLVTAYPPPLGVNVTASPKSGMAPLAVSFTAAITGGNAPYQQVDWNFGDGTLAFQQNVNSPVSQSHTYATPGTYTVTVMVNDGMSVGSGAVTVTVLPKMFYVSGTITPVSGLAPLTSNFSATAINGVGPYTMKWTIYQLNANGGDTLFGAISVANQTSPQWNVNYTIGTPGGYIAYLTVWDEGTGMVGTGPAFALGVWPPPPPMPNP